MFAYVTEHLNNSDSPIKMSTEAISYATVSKYARQELTSRNLKISLILDSGHRRETQEKQRKNQKEVLTEIVTQSLPFYNKNTSSTKVYDQGANR